MIGSSLVWYIGGSLGFGFGMGLVFSLKSLEETRRLKKEIFFMHKTLAKVITKMEGWDEEIKTTTGDLKK